MSNTLKKELAKVKKMIHPNSRKSAAIAKKTVKITNRTRAKQAGSMKQMLVGEKMLWLQENMVPGVCPYTPELTMELLEKYIARHDEELDFIAQKNKVIGKKNKSHASREDILRMSKEREKEEYEASGIEIPNIMIASQCSMLQKWDGDLRYLPNFIFRRWGKKNLEEAIHKKSKAEKSAPKFGPETEECPTATLMDADP
ncbi:translation machinery-associated protein 16 [Venturia canescens]|uniref:translation machinery-associated protein 16 n=1 Tax=Venturia canescens TaxID=32260 RepID=UPI001C9C135F|nr:translation machinery-associated protein 16 [Venturia canescens]